MHLLPPGLCELNVSLQWHKLNEKRVSLHRHPGLDHDHKKKLCLLLQINAEKAEGGAKHKNHWQQQG